MIFTRAGHARRRIVQAGDDVNIAAKWRERGEAGSQLVAGSGLGRDPKLFNYAVAVEPQHEAGLRRAGSELAGALGCVGDSLAVEHHFKRWQSDGDGGSLEK